MEVIMDGLRLYLDDPYTENCVLKVRRSGSEEYEVFQFPGEDPYLTEICDFVTAVRNSDGKFVESSYSDAAKTYAFTCAINNAEGKK